MKCTLGSLFDGSGGFPLAGSLCGITPKWAAEIEPYPIAVTRSRFPDMKHLGDISKVSGYEIEPVDIITFGSPCQDLSIAGKRAGLKHEANGDEETTRSGLFMEAVRIIKEMREATNGLYPRFALWENVPGAFSSNKGEDFRVVLEELIKIVEPEAVMPAVPAKGWAYADSYVGDGWSLAYRVFDAQYWGVPQRRRRIHLVLDLRGERARKVLFEREGPRGYFETSGAPRQGTAGDAESGIGAGNCEGERVINTFQNTGHGWWNESCVGATLRTPCGGYSTLANVVVEAAGFKGGQSMAGGIGWEKECAATLSAQCSGTEPTVCVKECLPFDTTQMTSPQNGCNGKGWKEDICYTLNTIDRPAVAYQQQAYDKFIESEMGTTIKACGGDYGGGSETLVCERKHIQYIVRRLTPTECARLQGFPDNWGEPDKKDDFTDEEYQFWMDVRNTRAVINGKAAKEYTKPKMLTWYNKLHTDSSEYKMWGNGIALPPALYCMQGMVEAMEGKTK